MCNIKGVIHSKLKACGVSFWCVPAQALGLLTPQGKKKATRGKSACVLEERFF